VPKSKKPSKKKSVNALGQPVGWKSKQKLKPKKTKKAGRKRDNVIPAGFQAQGDGFDALRDENDFLRAMLGQCLRCGSRMDDMALAQIHLEVVDGRLSERSPDAPRFHGHVYLGGGFGAGGDTREECLNNLRKNFTHDLALEFERAAKHPTAGVARNGYPDRLITPDFEAMKLLQELHADLAHVVTAFEQLQKHELWGGYSRIQALRDANEKLRREKAGIKDPETTALVREHYEQDAVGHEAALSVESRAMLEAGIESAKTEEPVKVDLAAVVEAAQTEDE